MPPGRRRTVRRRASTSRSACPSRRTYNGVNADEYVIGLVQYRTSFSSSLPDTLVRGYVQLETADNAGISQHWPVTNTLMDGTEVAVY